MHHHCFEKKWRVWRRCYLCAGCVAICIIVAALDPDIGFIVDVVDPTIVHPSIVGGGRLSHLTKKFTTRLAEASGNRAGLYMRNPHAASVVLTETRRITDGFGGQLHRTIMTYCICKEFGFSYLHTPMKEIELHPSDFATNTSVQELVDMANARLARFAQESVSARAIENYTIYNGSVTLAQLQRLRNVVVSWANSRIISADIPWIAKHARGMWLPAIKKNRYFTIGIHVRRGDLFRVHPKRILPNSYYIDIATRIVAMAPDCHYELYMELPAKYDSRFGSEDFGVIPNLTQFINEPLFATFDRMVNCDILVASSSAFSDAASYMKEGITVFPGRRYNHGGRSDDLDGYDPWLEYKLMKFILASRNQV